VSNRVEGVVYKIYDRQFRGRPSYTIKIDNDPIWYRAGEKRFAGIAESGNRVAFNAEMNPDGTSAKVVGEVTLASPAPVAANGTPASGGGGDRNNSIVYQSSLKAALNLVSIMAQTGALKLPAAQAKKVGAIEAAVDRYTAMFFDDVFTLGAVTREAEGAGETEGDDEEEGSDDEE
jgi:hypothetical protein